MSLSDTSAPIFYSCFQRFDAGAGTTSSTNVNTDATSIATIMFSYPVAARWVKIYGDACHGKYALRFEVLGCKLE